ncbi:SurA N-terminal domain-containing protein [Croceibacterium ferulae]|uniref:SurA N-terminal domain-containing protein n=1 Tax=Croceibacterium ferulae TaxID=1854641 RepID=UPI000EB01FF2|nr:SurA N-terminal domain-containing protein [Croceibacterium ferulae]
MTLNASKAPLVGLLLVTLAACNSKQPGEDAVATVNGYEITATELNNELAARGGQNIQDPALRRQALDELINRKLLVGLAQERELNKTPGYILNEQRMRELLLADAAVGFLATLNPKPDARQIDASVQAARGTRTIFQVEGLQFAPIADKAVMTALDRSASMTQVEQILATANVVTKPASLSWDSVAMPRELVQQLEGVPNGKPFVLSGPNAVFAGVVTGQQTQPLSPDQSRALAESVAAQATTQTTLANWLKEEKAKAEIVISKTLSDPTKQPQAADPNPGQ